KQDVLWQAPAALEAAKKPNTRSQWTRTS
ncbi:hypothetical protein WJX84_003101, partial [Apatococcus fuscideae]